MADKWPREMLTLLEDIRTPSDFDKAPAAPFSKRSAPRRRIDDMVKRDTKFVQKKLYHKVHNYQKLKFQVLWTSNIVSTVARCICSGLETVSKQVPECAVLVLPKHDKNMTNMDGLLTDTDLMHINFRYVIDSDDDIILHSA